MIDIHNFYVSLMPWFTNKFEIFYYFMDTLTFFTMIRLLLFLPTFMMGFRKKV